MRPGDVVGGYVLESHVARGGMGDVWRARRDGTAGFSRVVAFKRVHPFLIEHPDHVDQFLREARVGSWLRHPCVVPVLDVGVVDGAPFLVMEFVDGLDARRLATRAASLGIPLSAPLAGYIIHQTLCALEAAQSLLAPDGTPAALVHRDISPENILIGRHGDVRVADFGLAREMTGGRELTRAGIIKGKLSYMSPEQLSGGPVDGRSDLYSVGITFHELLCGSRPYDAANPLLAMQNTQVEHPHPTSLRPDLPSSLADLAHRWHSTRLEDRGPSIAAARMELEEVLAGLLAGVPSSSLAGLVHQLTHAPEQSAAPRIAPRVTVELALRRCAKCGGHLQPEQSVEGMILDRCQDCQGVWLDVEEVRRVVGGEARLGMTTGGAVTPATQAPLDDVGGDCPCCHVPLVMFAVPGADHFHVEQCGSCGGVWFDHGELDQCLDGDVAAAIRRAGRLEL